MKINKQYSGFTLIESLVAIGVMTYIFCGVMYIFSIATRNLAKDTIVEDTQHYFSRVIDQISIDLKNATSINNAMNGTINELRITTNNQTITYRQDNAGGYGISRNNGIIEGSGTEITHFHNYIFNHDKYDIEVEEVLWDPNVNIANNALSNDLRMCNCMIEVKFVVKIIEKNLYNHPFKRLVFHKWVFSDYVYAIS